MLAHGASRGTTVVRGLLSAPAERNIQGDDPAALQSVTLAMKSAAL